MRLTEIADDMTDEEYIGIVRGTVDLGNEAERFLKSNLGRYLIERAQAQQEAAFHEIRNLKLNEPDELLRIQNDVKVPELAIAWMIEAINARDEEVGRHEAQDEADSVLDDEALNLEPY